MRRLSAAAMIALIVLTSCADTPATRPSTDPPREETSPPDVAEIVCEADGTTSVLTPEVAVQEDGVHVHIENRLDEPASVGGLAFDASPGISDVTLSTPPGGVDVACWPFSEHGRKYPSRAPMKILDDRRLYTSPELECSGGTSWGSVFDFIRGTEGTQADPVTLARDSLRGLRPGDELEPVGYPASPIGVRVVRDDRMIAVVHFERTADGALLVAGGGGCTDDRVGIRP